MKSLLGLLLVIIFAPAVGQINAVTDTGDEVLLYEDGTWEYVDGAEVEETEIPTNETPFEKDKKSTFLIKSKKLNIGLWINPKEWSFEKGAEDDASEFKFVKKGEDLYGMLITEKIEVPLSTLKTIALENAKGVAPDTKVVHEEYRMVNGVKVLHMQLTGTLQGIRFTYLGYYYSSAEGSIQLVSYTADNLVQTYKKDIEILLNGLVVLEE